MTDVISPEAFQTEARSFLEANSKPREEITERGWGEGSDKQSLFAEKTKEEELGEVEAAKKWRTKLFDAGFGWITGPEEYGGRSLPRSYEQLYQGVEAEFSTPSQGCFGIGLGMVAPTILAHAIEDVKQQYLKSLWRGEIVGCQLFSEPSHGSDLAGIQTSAMRDGDEWILNGQKVWTSGAQYSDLGEVITRTSVDKPKHKGLTMFLVDMHAPGVEVRPLRQMTGGASFNEVFFTDVRVPDTFRLGDVDEGWTVALTTLMNERASIGGGGAGLSDGGGMIGRIQQLIEHLGLSKDPIVRERLAEVYIQGQVGRITSMRAMEKMRAGQLPGPEMSIGKLSLTNNFQRIIALLSHVLGPRLIADTGEWGTYSWAEFILGVPGIRIAGGTDEVMHNIVGERVLGLPKEPRVEA